MWSKIKAFLSFLRILDEQGQLSITNLLVVTFAIKFAMVPMESAGVEEMAMALGAMGVYIGKKTVNGMVEMKKAKEEVPADLVQKLKDMTEG